MKDESVWGEDLTAYNGFAAAVIAGVNAVLSGKTLL